MPHHPSPPLSRKKEIQHQIKFSSSFSKISSCATFASLFWMCVFCVLASDKKETLRTKSVTRKKGVNNQQEHASLTHFTSHLTLSLRSHQPSSQLSLPSQLNTSPSLIRSQALRTQHRAIRIPLRPLLGLPALLRLRHLQLQLPHRRRQLAVLLQFPLLLRRLLLLAYGPLARRADLARRRQAGLGEALLLRQILVFHERFIVVPAQLFAEEVLHEADVRGESFDAEGVVGRGRGEEDASCGRGGALIGGLVAVVQAVLEQVERDAEGFEAEFVGEPEFAEAEEVFVEVFGKVAADELLAAVIEGADAVCACVVAEGGALLRLCELLCSEGWGDGIHLQVSPQDGLSSSHVQRSTS